jgi:tRNA A58 N-methylase Trm61
MRWDMLSLLLLMGGPYGKVMLAEKSKGIVLAGVVLRGAEEVSVFSEESKSNKRYPILEQLNLDKSMTTGVKYQQWKDVNEEAFCATFDNFIMAGLYDFKGILGKFAPFLKKGCIVCLYCQAVEPLQEALQLMQEQKFVNIKLEDSWAREYQVLRNRTHPMMTMASCPGYLLSAIAI